MLLIGTLCACTAGSVATTCYVSWAVKAEPNRELMELSFALVTGCFSLLGMPTISRHLFGPGETAPAEGAGQASAGDSGTPAGPATPPGG